MAISISGKNLTVYHTEVLEKAEGKGLGKKLLSAMVDHARKNGLKVIALCPFVHAQFKRYPEEYVDIWNKESE
jgi:predicted GNAT family acetyltransferase